MREHDDCMTYETVAKEAEGGDSNSVSEQTDENSIFFLTVCCDFKYFHCSEEIYVSIKL